MRVAEETAIDQGELAGANEERAPQTGTATSTETLHAIDKNLGSALGHSLPQQRTLPRFIGLANYRFKGGTLAVDQGQEETVGQLGACFFAHTFFLGWVIGQGQDLVFIRDHRFGTIGRDDHGGRGGLIGAKE